MLNFLSLVLIPSIHLSSGNEKIILYACDCSNETLKRAKEFVAASNVASVENRFRPFYCDFATTGFPKWLVCANCRENLGQKDQICVSGSYLSCFLHCCASNYWLFLYHGLNISLFLPRCRRRKNP